MIRRAHLYGLLSAAAASALLSWHLDRPALWLDESASVVATQRTWSDLFSLLNGADAPLVPYYAALKLVTSITADLSPGVTAHPELLYRLPSLLAAVLAVWTLAVWLGRQTSILLTAASVAALLSTGGFSRYGQEARPYAVVMLMAVLATVAWDRAVTDRRRWVPVYALAVALLVATHLLAGSLVVAHLAAAALAPTEADPTGADPAGLGRRAALVRTAAGAGLGLALVAPFAVSASGHGVGPTKAAPATWDHLSTTFVGAFTDPYGPDKALAIGLTLLLAALGLAQGWRPGYRRITAIALTWAVVPILVLLPVMFARPNLIMPRYLVFVLPGWAMLTGLGVALVAWLVQSLAQELGRRLPTLVSRARPATSPVAAVSLGGLTAVLVLAGLGAAQLDTLRDLRAPSGHSEDIRASMAAANRPEYAHLPIVISSLYSSLEVAAYHHGAEQRIVGQRVPRDGSSIWPVADAAADQKIDAHRRVVLLLRAPSPARCQARFPGQTEQYVRHCLPKPLHAMGYRVETVKDGGFRWTFAVLSRPAGPSGRTAPAVAR